MDSERGLDGGSATHPTGRKDKIMEIEILAVFVSGVVGLGSVIFSGLSTIWSRKARIEPIKRRLYDQQITAASECANALVDLQLAIEKHHFDIGHKATLGKEEREKFIDSTNIFRENLKRKLYQWSFILPSEVFNPMAYYLSIVEYVANVRILVDGWPGASYAHEMPWSTLAKSFLSSISSVRDFLHIDPLSNDLSVSFRPSDEEFNKEVSMKTKSLGYLMSYDYRPNGVYEAGYHNPSEPDVTFD